MNISVVVFASLKLHFQNKNFHLNILFNKFMLENFWNWIYFLKGSVIYFLISFLNYWYLFCTLWKIIVNVFLNSQKYVTSANMKYDISSKWHFKRNQIDMARFKNILWIVKKLLLFFFKFFVVAFCQITICMNKR